MPLLGKIVSVCLLFFLVIFTRNNLYSPLGRATNGRILIKTKNKCYFPDIDNCKVPFNFLDYVSRRSKNWNLKKKEGPFVSTVLPRPHCSVYVTTHPLARGNLILPANQLISNLLIRISNKILLAKSIT